MTENDFKTLINTEISILNIKGVKVIQNKRIFNSIAQYEVIFAIIFKQNEINEIKVIDKMIELSFKRDDLVVKGSEVDDIHDLDYCAIFISCSISKQKVY